MTLYFSINPDSLHLINGALSLFWILAVSGSILMLGSVVHMTRFKLSWVNGVIFLVGIMIVIVGYNISWTKFYGLTLNKRQITLNYFFPKRTETFSVSDIKSFNRKYSGNGSLYYFLIETRRGKVYTSSAMHIPELNQNEMKLKRYMTEILGYRHGGK